MTPQLTRAYQLLDTARDVVDRCHPGTVAHLEQHATAVRRVLDAYGIDLTDPAQRDAVVAVVDLLVAVIPYGDRTLAATVADLQQTLIAVSRTPTHPRSTP